MKLLAKITEALTLAAALTLTACTPGGETGSTNPPSSVFASKTVITPGEICSAGGVQIDMGFDVNGNSVLDTDEITSTEYVCNGADAEVNPYVIYTSPKQTETGVELDTVINAVFNMEMDADTINATTFTVKDAAGSTVLGTVTYSGIVAAFQPAQSLVMNTKYTVTLSSAMQNDAAGIAMGYDHKIYFTTGDRATVKYMPNGADSGTVPVDVNTYNYNQEVTVLAKGDLTNGSLQFAGWNTKDDGTGTSYAPGAKFNMGVADVTLYAIWSFSLYIGMPFQGGVIAYIYQPGDPGYVSGETHGIIAALTDQSTGIVWISGGSTQSTYVPGGTGTALGSGFINTNKIIAQAVAAGNNTQTSYAAGIARSYDGGGYTDWYLPSCDELNKLYLNRDALGYFAYESYYWSSSQDTYDCAWAYFFYDGTQGHYNRDKYSAARVRAVRSF